MDLRTELPDVLQFPALFVRLHPSPGQLQFIDRHPAADQPMLCMERGAVPHNSSGSREACVRGRLWGLN